MGYGVFFSSFCFVLRPGTENSAEEQICVSSIIIIIISKSSINPKFILFRKNASYSNEELCCSSLPPSTFFTPLAPLLPHIFFFFKGLNFVYLPSIQLFFFFFFFFKGLYTFCPTSPFVDDVFFTLPFFSPFGRASFLSPNCLARFIPRQRPWISPLFRLGLSQLRLRGTPLPSFHLEILWQRLRKVFLPLHSQLIQFRTPQKKKCPILLSHRNGSSHVSMIPILR